MAKRLTRIPKPKGSKRVLAIADGHCGHFAGLTSPPWWISPERGGARFKKFAEQQRQLWGWYSNAMEQLQPIDCLIVNGDMVDGKGGKSGGTELIISDRNDQCDMAAMCIRRAHAPAVFMTHGTPYHAGDEEDWEAIIADRLSGDRPAPFIKIGSQEWIEVNGCVFDVKHQVGASSIPHGAATPVMREAIWNMVQSIDGEQPSANIFLRAHVHELVTVYWHGRLACIQPGLQGLGSKYGARRVSRGISVGLVAFDVMEDGTWQFTGGNPGRWIYDLTPHCPAVVTV